MPGMRGTPTAVTDVQKKFPPGTKLRSLLDDRSYIIGEKYRTDQFWMMCVDPPAKRTMSALSINVNFVKAD